jgi:predicted NBD/HSP70 family sugar kinase
MSITPPHPPRLLQVDRVSIGVDIGGSHVSTALVNSQGIILHTTLTVSQHVTYQANTATSLSSLIDIVASLVIPLIKQSPAHVTCIGIGVPGTVTGGILVAASNLPYLKNADICGALAAALMKAEMPAVIIKLFNDANCAICAEILYHSTAHGLPDVSHILLARYYD